MPVCPTKVETEPRLCYARGWSSRRAFIFLAVKVETVQKEKLRIHRSFSFCRESSVLKSAYRLPARVLNETAPRVVAAAPHKIVRIPTIKMTNEIPFFMIATSKFIPYEILLS